LVVASLPPDQVPDPLLAEMDRALKGLAFVPPASTWQRVRMGLAPAPAQPGRAIMVIGVILLSLLIMGALALALDLALAGLLTRPA